ncbi:efflux RND transporter periplasmic adaptor subunit [Allorhodopirellula heiligendammensis]|nr:efflux RND transporter periplasmic adaptor subunit [Allorhodopirellula heiligendammensis]
MPEVTVAKPIVKKIVEWDSYSGRLEPIEFVEVRSRVGGYLQSLHFEEGEIVNKGDLLFVIDPRPFDAELKSMEAAMSQANAQLLQAQAGVAEAEAQQLQSDASVKLADTRLKRARTLMSRDATSQDELDQREAEFDQANADQAASRAKVNSAKAMIDAAQAAIESASAGLEAAKLNVTYSKIIAPITGRISSNFVDQGNLVSGGASATATLLTTITSVEPIYCTFDVNEQEVLKYIRLAASGKRGSSREVRNPIYLGLVDEQGFPHQGHIDFVDNRFDPATATMRARGIFPNKNQVLFPGMFSRIRIPGSAPYEAVLIPDSAIGTDQASQFVFIVVDGLIERKQVELGPLVHGLRVVREGLSGDESLVIEGLLKARPELQVKVDQQEIEVIEDGLPDEYDPVPKEEWLSLQVDSEEAK